jgi:dolichyl-phosphate-mannose-protein mannosyltransferase
MDDGPRLPSQPALAAAASPSSPVRAPFPVLRIPILRTDGPLIVLLLCMIATGIALRAVHLDEPQALKWDEHHYVETARSYLAHKYAWNDHPPLSKLIIAGFMWALGDGPLAWRLPSFLFGVANIGLIGLLTTHVFRSKRAGLIAAAFVAMDGFFIAYSRTALLDGMIVAFSLASMLCVLRGRGVMAVLWAGVFSGCALSFKLNGAVFVFASFLACLASKPLRKYAPLLVLSALLVFYVQCAVALVNVGRSGSLTAVIEENRAMVKNHLGYTVVHPMSSKWYTWFLPTRPIYLRRDVDVDGSVRALLTLGNPLLWWAAIAAVWTTASALLTGGLGRLFRDVTTRARSERARQFWLLACYAGPIVFWIPALRDAYIYHYLPSYAFALPLLAGLVSKAYESKRALSLAFVLVIFEVSLVYAPMAAELPIAQRALQARLLPGWR